MVLNAPNLLIFIDPMAIIPQDVCFLLDVDGTDVFLRTKWADVVSMAE